MQLQKWIRKYWRRFLDLLSKGVDAEFDDLNWQAYSDAESKTLDIDTQDLSHAVLTLVSAGYAITRVVRSAKLIYVMPMNLLPVYTRENLIDLAVKCRRVEPSSFATLQTPVD